MTAGGIMEANITWKGGMAFETSFDGFKIMIDGHESVGGTGQGPTPKGLTLVSLGGCTGMDVVSILKKMKVAYDDLNIRVEAELADEHPKKFTHITVYYEFNGSDLPVGKINKAINLSEERYCGVSASLKPQVTIGHQLIINGEVVE